MARLRKATAAPDKRDQATDVVMPLKDKNKEELIEEIYLLQKRIAVLEMQDRERKRVEDALVESEGRLRDITFSMGDWVWEVDENGVYNYSSAKGSEILGRLHKDIIGKTPFDFMPPDEAKRVAGIFSEIVANKARIKDLENWNIRKNGEIICLLTNAVPILDEEGNLKGYRGVDKDITERKQMQEQLRTTAEEWHKTFNTIQDLIMIMDREFRIVRVNDAAMKFFGLPKEKIIGTPCYTLMHGTEGPIDGCPYKKMMETERHEETEVYDELRGKWFHIGVDPLYGAKGDIIGVVHTVKDITEYKLAWVARMESMERYQAVVESFDGLIYICSPDYRVEFMNRPLIERTGRNAVGEMCYQALHDRDSICEWCVNERVFQGETVRWEVQSPKDCRWYYVVNTPIRHADGTMSKQSMIMDITERKRVEKALAESRAQIVAVMNSTKDFIWSVDPERFGLLTWNRAFRDYFFEQRGIEIEVGMTPVELVPPDYVPLWHDLFSRALREEFVTTEYVVVAQTKTLLLSLHAMCRAHGVFGISVFGRDITELKQSEEELLAEKNKLQSIMSVMTSGITIRNPEYELIYQNDYSLNTFGNHLGEKCYRAFAGIDGVCDGCPVEKAFQDGKSHSHVKEVEILPGEITFWEDTAVPMRGSDGKIYACLEINNNITERKQAEKALRESEEALRYSQADLQSLARRLISSQEEELRRLSRELHDDLTQRLAVLAIEAGKLELGLRKIPEPCQETLQTISEIKDQLIKVSEDVHNISRQLHPTILDDLGLVRAIESECAALMRRKDLEITFRNEDVPAKIGNDIALCLYRVLQESLKNIITHSHANSCKIFLKGTDNTICLTVGDNGVGFDPVEVRNKPGLGLSSMRERVQLNLGAFSITSHPGKGTVINVCLPLTWGDV